MTKHEVPKHVDLRVQTKGIDYRMFYFAVVVVGVCGMVVYAATSSMLMCLLGVVIAACVVFPGAAYLSTRDPLLPYYAVVSLIFDPDYLDPAA